MSRAESLRGVARLVAAHAPRAEVAEALGTGDWDEWIDTPSASVSADADGRVAAVSLPVRIDTATVEELAPLGSSSQLPIRMAGDPSQYLIVFDEPDLPGLCRLVLATRDDGSVSSITLVPDIRL